MMHEMGEQPKVAPGNLDDAHKHRLKLAAKMDKNWRTLLQNHGADERVWAKLGPEELEYMHTKIEGWIKTCQDELAARPSPPKKNNIVDEWSHTLTFQNERIKELIDQKRAVT